MPRRADELVVVRSFSASHVRFADETPGQPSREARRVGRAQEWQRKTWEWHDQLPEFGFVTGWYGNALSRMSWEIGYGPDREQVRDEKGKVLPGVDSRALIEAENALEKLRGRNGLHSEWAKAYGRNLGAIGEALMLGYWIDANGKPVPENIDRNGKATKVADGGLRNEAATEEVWDVVSPTVVTTDYDGSLMVRRSEVEPPVTLPADTFKVIIRNPHPQYPDDAWAPAKGLGEVFEGLIGVERAMHAASLSRTHAGLLLVPSEGLGPSMLNEALSEGHPIVRDMIAGLTTPSRDPGSASLLVPTVLTVAGDSIEKWKHIALAREFDGKLIERATWLLRRLAQGLDVPPEVILGIAELNHWSTWNVTETAFRHHIEPMALLLADGLTQGYLWPTMLAAGVDRAVARRFRIAYDPYDLILNPDRSADATEAYKLGLLSAPATRRYLRFEEEDAPTEEELRLRSELGFLAKDRTRDRDIDAPRTEKEPPERQQAIRAASTPDDLEQWSTTVGEMDAAMLAEVSTLADSAVDEALSRAGARLRSKAQRDPVLSARLTGLRPTEVAARLTQRDIYALTEDSGVADLFADAFARLRERFRSILRSGSDALDALLSSLGFRSLSDVERALRDGNLAAAETVLEEGLLSHAEALLLAGAATVETVGEIPAGMLHPPSAAVRRALARAGGSAVEGGTAAMEFWEGGLMAGLFAGEVLSNRGVISTGVRWVYGMAIRQVNFPPHMALDGQTFTGWDDPDLSTGGTFGALSYWFPGDKNGCRCSSAPALVRVQETNGAIAASLAPALRPR